MTLKDQRFSTVDEIKAKSQAELKAIPKVTFYKKEAFRLEAKD